VQEMVDFVGLGFDLAFKYCNPVMILADGIVGQMMEKVVLPEQRPRRTDEQIREQCPWAANGRINGRKRNVITSLELESARMEVINHQLQAKYRDIEKNETRWEEIDIEGADYLIVAFGSIARICDKARELAAEKGIKVGIIRPITLWPFPTEAVEKAAQDKKGVLCVELNAGQMIEDVRLAVHDRLPVEHFGRLGGIIPSPEEVVEAIETKLIGK
ncbi:MAG: 3-methyl-2-oxobutanoate dehydrogenase subunit beta, partial [Muribaculaceae bacterium]|nr:3-methyl-2-oxobutanoate dehydrogenase subunit beta [Muribaculaceae bacterium]